MNDVATSTAAPLPCTSRRRRLQGAGGDGCFVYFTPGLFFREGETGKQEGATAAAHVAAGDGGERGRVGPIYVLKFCHGKSEALLASRGVLESHESRTAPRSGAPRSHGLIESHFSEVRSQMGRK